MSDAGSCIYDESIPFLRQVGGVISGVGIHFMFDKSYANV